jgi:hypothetical protein
MNSTVTAEQSDPEASLDRSEIKACFGTIGFNGMVKDDEHEEKYLYFDWPV